MTAQELLGDLTAAGCVVTVDGCDLCLDGDGPERLERYLPLLHTGVRAILAGRKWFGLDGATGRITDLLPAARLPRNVTLAAVEGRAEVWDRFGPWVLVDFPECFESESPATPSARAKRTRSDNPLEGLAS